MRGYTYDFLGPGGLPSSRGMGSFLLFDTARPVGPGRGFGVNLQPRAVQSERTTELTPRVRRGPQAGEPKGDFEGVAGTAF